MEANARIDIISDAICPWCYIGKRQLERALPVLASEGLRLSVQWHAYQLNPDMPAGGVVRAEYRARKFGSVERAAELDARITASAAAVGLAFRTDLMQRTPNTIDAHRIAWLAYQSGPVAQDAVVEAMFRAYFVNGQDIGDHAVLAACAEQAGLNSAAAATFLAGDEGRSEVLAEDASARRAGLYGVPTFAMNGHVMFSGAVPAETMVEAFRSAWKVLGKAAA